MGTQRHKPEEIVMKLRQVGLLVGQGMARVDVIREVRITEQTYYRWLRKYGGLGTEQLKELKRLQKGEPLSPPLVRGQWRASGLERPCRT